MRVLRQLNSDNIFYSCIFGRGLYEKIGETEHDPFGDDEYDKGVAPILRNILTGEVFFMKLARCTQEVREKYIRDIKRPPVNAPILWPVDMIDIQEKDVVCSFNVMHEYTEDPGMPVIENDDVGILFPYKDHPSMVEGKTRFRQLRELSWKDIDLVNVAMRITEALEDLNRNGYIYGDIHPSRLFFGENDKVTLAYSGLVISMADVFSDEAGKVCSVRGNEYPIEFAEPSVYLNKHNIIDFQAQNHSLAALLFYLFFNRYPYDGSLLDENHDVSPQSHYAKFRKYHKLSVFIFDDEDDRNALGAFAEEIETVDLWQDLPENLKGMFRSVLKQSNAQRTGGYIDNPTPSMWLEAMRSLM